MRRAQCAIAELARVSSFDTGSPKRSATDPSAAPARSQHSEPRRPSPRRRHPRRVRCATNMRCPPPPAPPSRSTSRRCSARAAASATRSARSSPRCSALEAAPTLVPYTLSLRARRCATDVPPDTRFVPWPARALLRSWARSDVPRIDRWLRPAAVVHATNYLAPPSRIPDARERLRLLVRAVSRAVHAGGARARAARAPRDRARRDRAHQLGVRRERDRGALRARDCAAPADWS